MTKFARVASSTIMMLSFSVGAQATYQRTDYLSPINIFMDNGVTYFNGFTTTGTCAYNRLMLNDTGDYYGSIENGRRMYALIVAAQLAGKAISLGYNDGDG